jgi:signal transduction histidine kinase
MMRFHYDEVGKTGLQFFGKMTASIAHEVKNVLAIINENAGLLNDFALLAQKGRPLDPERLENTAQNILRQISRADGIVKNMSAFAHSVDGMEKQVDFNELTRRIILLAGRLVSIRGISITLIPSEKAVMLNTNPFLLENLIWLTLAYAMDLAGSAKEIFAEIRKEGDEISLNLSKLGHLEQMSQQCPPEQSLKKLLAVIEAELVPDIVREELILRFSEKI